jgi:hypothetical protein
MSVQAGCAAGKDQRQPVRPGWLSVFGGHYLYADDLEVVATNHVTLAPFAVPEPMTIQINF